MTKPQKPSERMSIVTRAKAPPETMLRFVLSPDGVVTPDIKRRLPGRGVWVETARGRVAEAVERRAFPRAFKAQAEVPATLADDVEALLRRAALSRLAFAHKAGLVATGFEKVRAALRSDAALGVIVASDGAADGRAKVQALAKHASNLHKNGDVVDVFASWELERLLGRDRVVHAALAPGRLSELFILDAERLRVYVDADTQARPHP